MNILLNIGNLYIIEVTWKQYVIMAISSYRNLHSSNGGICISVIINFNSLTIYNQILQR